MSCNRTGVDYFKLRENEKLKQHKKLTQMSTTVEILILSL